MLTAVINNKTITIMRLKYKKQFLNIITWVSPKIQGASIEGKEITVLTELFLQIWKWERLLWGEKKSKYELVQKIQGASIRGERSQTTLAYKIVCVDPILKAPPMREKRVQLKSRVPTVKVKKWSKVIYKESNMDVCEMSKVKIVCLRLDNIVTHIAWSRAAVWVGHSKCRSKWQAGQ